MLSASKLLYLAFLLACRFDSCLTPSDDNYYYDYFTFFTHISGKKRTFSKMCAKKRNHF